MAAGAGPGGPLYNAARRRRGWGQACGKESRPAVTLSPLTVSYVGSLARVLCRIHRSGTCPSDFSCDKKEGSAAVIKIAPSILAADFANLERDIYAVRSADYLHVDVMDGLFVPNISIGVPVVQSIRAITSMPLDVHLMIDQPVRYVERFCQAGADIVTVHVEADSVENTLKALEIIRAQGKRSGVVLKPGTPAEDALPFLDRCSMVLVMTVEPGFGGQKFMTEMMPKLRQIRKWIDSRRLDCELEVDGGVDPVTCKTVIENGANVLVAGSAVYKAPDIPERIKELRG